MKAATVSNLVFLLAVSVILISSIHSATAESELVNSVDGLQCNSCGLECSVMCGSRKFRTCCFNYIKKRSINPAFPRHSTKGQGQGRLFKRHSEDGSGGDDQGMIPGELQSNQGQGSPSSSLTAAAVAKEFADSPFSAITFLAIPNRIVEVDSGSRWMPQGGLFSKIRTKSSDQ